MMQTMASSSSSNSNSKAAAAFAILGDFPGDQALLVEINECGRACLSSQSPSPSSRPPLTRLVLLLESLPHKGRIAFVQKFLVKSPYRDELLREMFDYCFQPSDKKQKKEEQGNDVNDDADDEDDDEFVLIANPTTMGRRNAAESQEAPVPLKPLNLEKFHIFQLVIILLAASGSVGAELSLQYLSMTASTKYRAKILIQSITCFDQDDDEFLSNQVLWEQYQASPGSVQSRVIDACKRSGKHKDLLRRIYEQSKGGSCNDDSGAAGGGSNQTTTTHDDLIYWLDAAYVATKIHDLVFPKNVSDKKKKTMHIFKLKRWGALGNVYIALLRQEMEKVKNDQLELGKVWHHFRSCMEFKSVQSSHVQALMQVLDEYPAYTVQTSLPHAAQTYLEELSALGQDVSNFDGIVRIHIGSSRDDKDLWLKLSNQERLQLEQLQHAQRLQLALECLKKRDWDRFCSIKDSVPRHKLPYQEIFSLASPVDLLFPSDTMTTTTSLFLQYFSENELIQGASNNGKERAEIIKSWTDMHFRCKPSDLSDEQRIGGKSNKDLWKIWHKSYAKLYSLHFANSSTAFSRLEQEAKSVVPLLSYSRLEQHSHDVHGLLDMAVRGMEDVWPYLKTRDVIDPVWKMLCHSLYNELEKTKVETAGSLVQKGAKIITAHLLPKLDTMMQFDPSAEETYISSDSIQYFKSSVGDICRYWLFSKEVAQSIAAMLLDVSVRADSQPQDKTQGFIILTDEDGQKKRRMFKYYNYGLHQQAKQVCCELVKQVLMKVRLDATFDASLLQQMWNLVAVTVNEPGHVSAYLDACEKYLPTNVLKEEQQSMIKRSRAFIIDMGRQYPDKWKDHVQNVARQLVRLGLLDSVLDCKDISLKFRSTLLADHAGFGNEIAQQSLKEAMFVANAESRVQALINWLTAAFATKSTAFISEAMSFAASRLKNEAGIHRKTVFSWLEKVITSNIIDVSLKDEAESSEVHKKLCSAIFAIQKNDSCRLDSIGRQCFFPMLPSHILDAVLGLDPSRLCLERRQLWANLAIQLHWAMQKVTSGDESLHCYQWPGCARELKSASWVSIEAFEAVYPPSKPSSLSKIGLLGQRACNALHKDFDRETVFGPTQCIQMLEKAIDSVWNEADLGTCALRLDGYFPEEEKVAEALCSRLQFLFRLCGTVWQEVELLTTIFDHIFSNIENSSTMHFEQASQLLRDIFDLHEGDIFPVPRLVKACDMMFRHAVAKKMATEVQQWLGTWQKCYLEHDYREFDFQVDDRLEMFLQKNGHGCEPECWRLVVAKDDRIVRECKMASELLCMSTSALLLHDVRTILFERRQDIILRCVREEDSLQGIFHENGDHGTVDELLYHTTVKDEWIVSCHADVSRRYANWACTQASSTNQDLESKIEAIEKFMNAPSTQHDDVLAALQSTSDAAVREALIHRVFSLDAPWYILGFLLSQKAIEKNDQRVTSALLGYVAKHVHIDKVVRVAGVLLKNPRRKKLSIQLHKGVIRMLFDAKTVEAMQLLRVEWENDLPNGVRILIVEKCIDLVAKGKTEGWEASVLSQVATNQSFGLELKFCLFAPQSPDASLSSSIYEADGVSSDELLEQFQQKGPSFFYVYNHAAINKFRLIMHDLENSSDGTLQYLAKLQKLALSDLFTLTPLNDPVDPVALDLDDLVAYLTDYVESTSAATSTVDHKIQVGMQFVSTLFAKGVCKLLHHTIPSKIHERTTENITELCNNNAAVLKLRDFIQCLLNAALDLPIRKQSQRLILLKSLESIFKNVRNKCPAYIELLIIKPFQTELSILKKDASMLNGALVSAGR